MDLNMKMSSKIASAFFTLTALVLVSGIAGYYGVNRLSESLEYVTGPAWDSADGAMEGSISTQAEMLVIEEIFAGLANMETVHAEMKAHSDSAEEAMDRMKNSGLLSESATARAINAEHEYVQAAEEVVEQFEAFLSAGDLKEAMGEAGVLDAPTTIILNELGKG